MKKILSIMLGLVLSLSMFANVSFASASSQEEWDRVNSNQAVTQQTPEELQKAKEKCEDVKALDKALILYSKNKIAEDKLDDVLSNFNSKHGTRISKDSFTTDSLTSSVITRSDPTYGLLNWSCAMQEENWYCGPASAYNVLRGQGVTSNNGRILSQYNLASDLNALYGGASWPGNWASTMRSWSNVCDYIALSGPITVSDMMSYTRYSVRFSYGLIYDTYMSGTNQLVGYDPYSTRYHYVAGDGFDYSNNTIHYLDSNNVNNSAFGTHWTSASIMCNTTSTRGIVF